MHERDEIYNRVVEIMVELFELDSATITPESQLYDELDIDSIDAVDLLVELKNYTGRKVAPEDFKSVRTVADVVDSVHEVLAG